MEKYRELFNLSKKVLNEEINRYRSLDEKAYRYLTALTFLLGMYGFFVSKLFPRLFPPHCFLDWLLVIILFLLFLFIVLSWFLLFSILRTACLATTPLNISFFEKNKLVNIYYSLAKTNREALLRNTRTNDHKSVLLKWGYCCMQVTMLLIVLLFICFAFYACYPPS